jgi:hypothetical protein
MKALILTETLVASKRIKMIKERLVKAGYEVVEKSFDENTPFDGCSFDFVVVDELSKTEDNCWFGVITEIKDLADSWDRESVIIGKKYPLYLDAQGAVCFTDEQGERNYGCDSEEDSVYKFYRI